VQAKLTVHDAPGGDPAGPRVSIVIPVFNKIEFTRPCLESLARHTPVGLAEIIVVDNGSTDGTAEYLAGMAPQVRTLRNPDNLGFARACNLGAASAGTAQLLFLNNDTVAHEHWLEPLLALLDGDPAIVAAGSKLLFPDGTLQHAGVIFVEDRRLPGPIQARHAHYAADATQPDANQRRCYQALTAACLLVRRAAFERAGGFDEGYWNGYEDVDLCLKLQELGGRLVYEPTSVLTHHESKSGPERFTKVKPNIERLHARWHGRLEADVVIDAQGKFVWTEACRIREYALPAPVTSNTAERTTGLVSIVILSFNQLEYTKLCLASLEQHTPDAHEILFVDNGSTDGTVGWLREQVRRDPRYRLIENARNEGFAHGCNQGMAVARGEFVLLLNNDVVVGEHWLEGLLECLKRTPDGGLVGPVTNQISGRQRIEHAGYGSIEAFHAFAARWRERHRHQRIYASRVVGFCMLFHASLMDRIGGLDERFGTGNYEDDDLCLRAELAGFKNLIAGDVFVHHYGSRSFAGNHIEPRSALAGNRKRFVEKWRCVGESDATSRRVLVLDALERAHDLDHSGRLRDAVELCLEAIRVSPAETTPYLTLAGMLVRTGSFQDALEVLQNLPSGFASASARLLGAMVRLGLGDTESALRLVASIEDEPDLSVRAQALNLKGLIAHGIGESEAARAHFEAAMATDCSYGEPHANLGWLLWADEPGQQALRLFERGLVLSPESPDALEFFCTAAKALEVPGHAAAVVREARGLHPIHRGLTFALIDLLLAQGRHADAMLEIENALEWFELDAGLLRAALAVRAQVGPLERSAGTDSGVVLSLCMIVKNETTNLVRCLRSVMPVVDEVIIVDTGSTDGTADLACALGAKLSTLEWNNDFAAARNASLAGAKGDWLLVLDADEALDAADLVRLRAQLTDPATASVDGYTITTRNYTCDTTTAGWTPNDGLYGATEAGTGWFPSHKVRLFKNDPRIRFEGALHEVVDDSLHRHGLCVRDLDVPVHHYGPLQADRQRDKAGTYYALAQAKLAGSPHDVRALFELAVQAAALGRYDEAIEAWTRYVKVPEVPRLALAWMNLGHAYLESDQFELSARASRAAIANDPEAVAGRLNLALCELCRGRHREAVVQAERALALRPGHVAVLGLLAAANALARDSTGFQNACAQLEARGEPPAAFLQACAARLRRAGRGADVRRLTGAARALWKATLTRQGHAATDEQLTRLLEQASAAVVMTDDARGAA
jgi:GT2 family glycosyltransferase/Tfp pilus assembly protein PilF